MNLIDLTGKKFENLTVLYRGEDIIQDGKRRRVRWHCLCNCGREFDVISDNLKRRQNMTCNECAKKIRGESQRKNAVGNKYGRLTILEMLPNSGATKVRCMCDCGNEYIGCQTDIVSGHTKSCGCLQSEIASLTNTKDWTGYVAKSGVKFIRQNHKNNSGQLVWECQCPICHNSFYELPAKVNNGHTTSCGCRIQSFGESYIQLLLENIKANFIPQYTFPDCKYINTLHFDFAIFYNDKLLGLVEYDGKQHFEPIDFFGGKEGFEKTKKRDEVKNIYCTTRNIPLLRIPYTLSFDDIKKELYEYYLSLTTAGCA